MLDSQIREAIAILQDEHLVWSEDMELIRGPLAALIAKIHTLPTHQLDDEMDELVLILLGAEPYRV